jgi:hypothetical protein
MEYRLITFKTGILNRVLFFWARGAEACIDFSFYAFNTITAFVLCCLGRQNCPLNLKFFSGSEIK